MIISSKENHRYRELQGLWTSRGIRRSCQTLVCGQKLVQERLQHDTNSIVAVVFSPNMQVPEHATPLPEIVLSAELFRELDQLGTQSPILVCSTQIIPEVSTVLETTDATVVLPLQNPENLGAAIRSALAFGVRRVVLTNESAHPYLPRAIRSSAGTVFHTQMERVKGSWRHLSLPNHKTFVLDARGDDLSCVVWPDAPVFLLGEEGQGVGVTADEFQRIKIPMEPRVESLNATVALSIALYAWVSR